MHVPVDSNPDLALVDLDRGKSKVMAHARFGEGVGGACWSPDGRWIVFVKCRNGQLMRPDGKLWIVPAGGGKARQMRCNTSLMNSWHSFSPNGKWMVFSSKSNTPYTQMFLTHIDENGNDSPAILIENSTAANRAVNIPEFVNVAYEDFQGISVPATEHHVYFRRGTELAKEGRYDEAVVEFDKALEGQPKAWRTNDWRIHESLSKSLLRTGDNERAMEIYEEFRERFPENPAILNDMYSVSVRLRDFDADGATSSALCMRALKAMGRMPATIGRGSKSASWRWSMGRLR